jgi:hypothetical protein
MVQDGKGVQTVLQGTKPGRQITLFATMPLSSQRDPPDPAHPQAFQECSQETAYLVKFALDHQRASDEIQ